MKNKKLRAIIPSFILIISLCTLSLFKSISSGVTIKIIASSIGTVAFLAMFVFFFLRIRKQEIN